MERSLNNIIYYWDIFLKFIYCKYNIYNLYLYKWDRKRRSKMMMILLRSCLDSTEKNANNLVFQYLSFFVKKFNKHLKQILLISKKYTKSYF